MKPKNLKTPFTWDERKVLIEDRVWYVPKFYDQYDEFTFPGWDSPELFGNQKPVNVEYCSGNGAWIAQKAQEHPEYNWVAVEIKFKRVRKIWSKIKNLQLKNLLVICGEGLTVTSNYFPDESVQETFINFPDPWPKLRHAKHRIIQPAFVEEMQRVMKKGAVATLVTDDPEYSGQMVECMLGNERFKPCFPDPHYTLELNQYGTSYFDTLWRGLGRRIHYHQFEKRG